MGVRYFETHGPAWKRRSKRPVNRPGLVMNGVVVMAPGYLDTTGAGQADRGLLDRLRVYVNGVWANNALAYDEREGTVLVGSDMLRPQLIRGKVRAVPRALRFQD